MHVCAHVCERGYLLDFGLDGECPVPRGGEDSGVHVANPVEQGLQTRLVVTFQGDLCHLAVELHRLQTGTIEMRCHIKVTS